MTKEEKDEIRKELALEKADPALFVTIVAKLMNAADVKVNDSDLKSALDVFKIDEDEDAEEDRKRR